MLGIDGAADLIAIRKAYAARLKQTHPEDDPDGFQRLREAYEFALAVEQQRREPRTGCEARPAPASSQEPARRDASPVPRTAQELSRPLVAVSETSPPGSPAPPPEAVPDADPFERHWVVANRLGDLMRRRAAQEDILSTFADVLASPAMMNVEVYERTSLGLAQAVLHFTPVGDALTTPLIQHFSWRDEANRLDARPLVLALLRHEMDLSLRETLREGRHSLSRAYLALAAPPPLRRSEETRLLEPEVRYFLALARAEAPFLAADFDEHSVAWWTRGREEPAADPAVILGQQSKAMRLESARRACLVAGGALFFVVAFLVAALVIQHAPEGPGATRAAVPEAGEHPVQIGRRCTELARMNPRAGDLAVCDRAVDLLPSTGWVKLERAFMRLKLGQAEAAVDDFDRVLRIDRTNPYALLGRSIAHWQAGDARASRRDLEAAFASEPDTLRQTEVTYGVRPPSELLGSAELAPQ